MTFPVTVETDYLCIRVRRGMLLPILLLVLWSARKRPGSQTPRRSLGDAPDQRFQVGDSSTKTVQTGMWSRSDRADTARTVDGT